MPVDQIANFKIFRCNLMPQWDGQKKRRRPKKNILILFSHFRCKIIQNQQIYTKKKFRKIKYIPYTCKYDLCYGWKKIENKIFFDVKSIVPKLKTWLSFN